MEICCLCGQEAKFQLKNKKWYCQSNARSCPSVKEKFRNKALSRWKEIENSGKKVLKDLVKEKLPIVDNGLCSYGCGRPWKFKLKRKYCCEDSYNKCPEVRRKNGEKQKKRILKSQINGTYRNGMLGKISWNNGLSKETDIRIKKSASVLKAKYDSGEFKGSFVNKHHTKESKIKMSISRKLFLKNNPNKHSWKYHNKYISHPCEKLKQLLKDKNILFTEEYSPKECNKNYSLDIAFPDRKLAIEVNGQQHYNSNKSLKEYYQNRHDELELLGWTIIEIHYSIIYKEKKINDIINSLKL